MKTRFIENENDINITVLIPKRYNWVSFTKGYCAIYSSKIGFDKTSILYIKGCTNVNICFLPTNSKQIRVYKEPSASNKLRNILIKRSKKK